jgi:hypothetical protein
MLAQTQPSTRDPDLVRKVVTVPSFDSLAQQFAATLREAGVSGGVADIHAGCSEARKLEMPALQRVTAAQALDTLALVDGIHRWQIADGSVVLLPTGGTPTLLDTNIASVHLSDIGNLDLSISELLAEEEVVTAMKKQGIAYQGWRGGFSKLYRNTPKPPPRPLALQDVTLLQALNSIARQYGNAVWSYQEFECHGRTFQLQFASR